MQLLSLGLKIELKFGDYMNLKLNAVVELKTADCTNMKANVWSFPRSFIGFLPLF